MKKYVTLHLIVRKFKAEKAQREAIVSSTSSATLYESYYANERTQKEGDKTMRRLANESWRGNREEKEPSTVRENYVSRSAFPPWEFKGPYTFDREILHELLQLECVKVSQTKNTNSFIYMQFSEYNFAVL